LSFFFFRPTHSVLHVSVFFLCASTLQKLPLYPPLLSQLSAWCFIHCFWSCPRLRFVIFAVFPCHLLTWCATWDFNLNVVPLSSSHFQKLLIDVNLLSHSFFYCFQQRKPILGYFLFFIPMCVQASSRCQR
jgi:hypothetical protein